MPQMTRALNAARSGFLASDGLAFAEDFFRFFVTASLASKFSPLCGDAHSPCHKVGLTQHALRARCKLYHDRYDLGGSRVSAELALVASVLHRPSVGIHNSRMTWRTRNPAGVCVDGQDSAVHFRILSTELFLRPVVLFTLYVPTQRVTRKLLSFNRFQWGRTLHSDLLLRRCRHHTEMFIGRFTQTARRRFSICDQQY